MIILSGHATRVGKKIHEVPTVLLLESLNQKKQEFFYIRHAIDGKALSQLCHYADGMLRRTHRLPSIFFLSPLRYISELILNLIIVLFLRLRYSSICYIGIDPLNALSGIVLRRMRSIRSTVFYSVDYSHSRFSHALLNSIYQWTDRFAAKNSDETWNVSSRIYDLHVKQNGSDKNQYFVPNVPIMPMTRAKNANTHQLITSGVLSDQLDFKNLFLAVKNLIHDYPDMSVLIAGDGPSRQSLEKLRSSLKLRNVVSFLGYITREEFLSRIESSGVGLALYTGAWSFNYFGDSMKCREFLSAGLPVITTDTHSTAADIELAGAGIVSDQSAKSYEVGLRKIFNDYSAYSTRAKKLSEMYQDIHIQRLTAVDSAS